MSKRAGLSIPWRQRLAIDPGSFHLGRSFSWGIRCTRRATISGVATLKFARVCCDSVGIIFSLDRKENSSSADIHPVTESEFLCRVELDPVPGPRWSMVARPGVAIRRRQPSARKSLRCIDGPAQQKTTMTGTGARLAVSGPSLDHLVVVCMGHELESRRT